MNYDIRSLLTSFDVADRLGITIGNLRVYLHRYPELKPALRLSGDDQFWSPHEVERLVEHRQRRRKKQTE